MAEAHQRDAPTERSSPNSLAAPVLEAPVFKGKAKQHTRTQSLAEASASTLKSTRHDTGEDSLKNEDSARDPQKNLPGNSASSRGGLHTEQHGERAAALISAGTDKSDRRRNVVYAIGALLALAAVVVIMYKVKPAGLCEGLVKPVIYWKELKRLNSDLCIQVTSEDLIKGTAMNGMVGLDDLKRALSYYMIKEGRSGMCAQHIGVPVCYCLLNTSKEVLFDVHSFTADTEGQETYRVRGNLLTSTPEELVWKGATGGAAPTHGTKAPPSPGLKDIEERRAIDDTAVFCAMKQQELGKDTFTELFNLEIRGLAGKANRVLNYESSLFCDDAYWIERANYAIAEYMDRRGIVWTRLFEEADACLVQQQFELLKGIVTCGGGGANTILRYLKGVLYTPHANAPQPPPAQPSMRSIGTRATPSLPAPAAIDAKK